MKIAIGAIVRNEAPYLLEWIAWHRRLGVSGFVLFDHDSDDGTTELLRALDDAGIVQHVPFAEVAGTPPQIRAYRALITSQISQCDCIALIDTDEFIQMTGDQTLLGCFETIPAQVGAIVMNWATFGSSGIKGPNDPVWPAPCCERFQRRAEQHCELNLGVKSVLRPEAVDLGVPFSNPHSLPLRQGYVLARPNGQRLDLPTDGSVFKTAEVDWSVLRLNHYMVKSYSEYIYKKLARGDAFWRDARPMGHFDVHDRNEIFDPTPSAVLPDLLTDMSLLRGVLPESWHPAPIPEAQKSQGVVERLLWDDAKRCFILEGFFVDSYGLASIHQLGLALGWEGHHLLPQKIELFHNAQAQALHSYAQSMCGVRAWFPYGASAVPTTVEVRSGFNALLTVKVEAVPSSMIA